MKRSSPLKGRPYAILAAILAATALTVPVVLTAPGCGLQGEGQRCDRNTAVTPSDPTTGNDDCGEGLECRSKDLLGGSADICCPKNNGQSDNPNCQIGGGEGGGSAASSSAMTSAAATTSSGTSTGAATSSASSSSATTSSGTSTSTGTGSGGAGGGP